MLEKTTVFLYNSVAYVYTHKIQCRISIKICKSAFRESAVILAMLTESSPCTCAIRNPNGGFMKKVNTKKLVATALMIAIILLLDITGIGYFNIGPLQLTLMCVPVVIGTLTLGYGPGLLLGLAFAATSIAKIPQNVFYSVLFTGFFPLMKQVLVCLIPRLLIPTFVHLTGKLMKKTSGHHLVRNGIASAVGPLTNTVFFLGLFYLFFHNQATMLTEDMYALFMSSFTIATSVNAVAELVMAVIICPPIIFAVNKAFHFDK